MASGFSPEDIAKGQARGREVRAAIKKRINVTSVPWPTNEHETRRREPDEVAALRMSVKWNCFECVGYESAGLGSVKEHVRQCPVTQCPMYPWRGGEFDKSFLED